MIRYCAICGRQLRKTMGTVGPVCERRHSTKRRRKRPKLKLKTFIKHDIFGENNGSKET